MTKELLIRTSGPTPTPPMCAPVESASRMTPIWSQDQEARARPSRSTVAGFDQRQYTAGPLATEQMVIAKPITYSINHASPARTLITPSSSKRSKEKKQNT